MTPAQIAGIANSAHFMGVFNRYSDETLYSQAEEFAKLHKCSITSSQISGLVSVCGTIGDVTNIVRFCRHQANKARYSDLRDFWTDLAAKINENADAGRKTICLKSGITVEGQEAKALELLIVQEFVRHLRAEYTLRSGR